MRADINKASRHPAEVSLDSANQIQPAWTHAEFDAKLR